MRLAKEAGVSVETIKRLERMSGVLEATKVVTLGTITKALAKAGIVFVEEEGKLGPGVRMRLRK